MSGVLGAIRARAEAYATHGTPGLASPVDRKALLLAVEAALALADTLESYPTCAEVHVARQFLAAIENALATK